MIDVNDLQQAQRAAGHLVGAVSDWDAATPCPGLSARDLVGHLIGGDVMITDLLVDQANDSSTLGKPTAERYRSAANDLIEAYRTPGAAQKTILAPIGPASGGQMLVMRTIEHVVHGWDIASSQGLPTDELAGLAEPLIPICGVLFEQLRDVVTERRPFADPRPVAEAAPPLDRLVALLGRDPHWAAPANGRARSSAPSDDSTPARP